MPESDVTKAAKALSARGASKGGRARAEQLTAEERSAVARTAAAARWGVREAVFNGELHIGDRNIPCAVLDDGTRIISQGGFLLSIGRSRTPKAKTGMQVAVDQPPTFLAAKNLKPYVTKDLLASTKPVKDRDQSGGVTFGYNAEALPAVCRVFMEAEENGDLSPPQRHIAKACKIVVMALATVGIVALVDEATGYQEDRARDALAKILERYISEELRQWVKTFPNAYFQELARLRGVHLSRISVKRPQYFGILTNDVVYNRLAPGVLSELQRITPKTKKGRRKHTFHQRLSEDAGHPKLREHLASVIALMKACDDWDTFKKLLDRALPKYKAMPLFDDMEGEE